MKNKVKLKTFKDVVSHFGSVQITSEKLNISKQSVYFYMNGERKVSPEVAAKVDVLTEGKISRKNFFPDNWHVIWAEFKDAA